MSGWDFGNYPHGWRELAAFDRIGELHDALIEACLFCLDADDDSYDDLREPATYWLQRLRSTPAGEMVACSPPQRMQLVEIAAELRQYENMMDGYDDNVERQRLRRVLDNVNCVIHPHFWRFKEIGLEQVVTEYSI